MFCYPIIFFCAAAVQLALAADASLPAASAADSLYQMRAALTTQSGARAGLDLYRGHPAVMAMFYGSCPAACPMLITSIQTYEGQLDDASRARLRVAMISFDAARDTPQRLQEIARMHAVDAGRWTFSSAADAEARKIAALLGVQYRRLPDGEFDHSLLITLLDRDGRVVASTVNLNGDENFLAALRKSTAAEH